MKNGRQLSHPHIIQRIRDAGHKIVVHDPKAEPLDLFSAPDGKYYPDFAEMLCSGILISDRLRAKHAMRNHDGHGYRTLVLRSWGPVKLYLTTKRSSR